MFAPHYKHDTLPQYFDQPDSFSQLHPTRLVVIFSHTATISELRMIRFCLFVSVIIALLPAAALCAEDTAAADAAKKLAGDHAAQRDEGAAELRKLGAAAIPVLRETKPEDEDKLKRVRDLLTDLATEHAKIVPEDAAMLHELGREEGRGKRYANAERLYKRAEDLYKQLEDDAGRRKDREKKSAYGEKKKLCDRMKDKAGHKVRGDVHTGINLGIVRVGKDHDMSDDWE
jgi:hypothetical protein